MDRGFRDDIETRSVQDIKLGVEGQQSGAKERKLSLHGILRNPRITGRSRNIQQGQPEMGEQQHIVCKDTPTQSLNPPLSDMRTQIFESVSWLPSWAFILVGMLTITLLGWLLSWAFFTKISVNPGYVQPLYASKYLVGLTNYQLKNIKLYDPIKLRDGSLLMLITSGREVRKVDNNLVLIKKYNVPQSTKVTSAIIIPAQLIHDGCPNGQKRVNGKCLSCPKGAVWIDNSCEKQKNLKDSL